MSGVGCRSHPSERRAESTTHAVRLQLDLAGSRQGRTDSMQSVRMWCRVHRISKVGELLESYILQSTVVPTGSYQIREPTSVPRDVRQVVTDAVKDGQTWSCWAHGLHIWLFTCSLSPLSRKSGVPVLQVSLYGDHGELRDHGTWIPDQQGKSCRSAAAPAGS